jgi:hypothetical protein
MNFSDLKFEEFQETGAHSGVHVLVFFNNGFGASVIKSNFSYGGKEGLYELAVIKGNQDDWAINYKTPITGDVLGYLTEEDVEEYLNQIEARL